MSFSKFFDSNSNELLFFLNWSHFFSIFHCRKTDLWEMGLIVISFLLQSWRRKFLGIRTFIWHFSRFVSLFCSAHVQNILYSSFRENFSKQVWSIFIQKSSNTVIKKPTGKSSLNCFVFKLFSQQSSTKGKLNKTHKRFNEEPLKIKFSVLFNYFSQFFSVENFCTPTSKAI